MPVIFLNIIIQLIVLLAAAIFFVVFNGAPMRFLSVTIPPIVGVHYGHEHQELKNEQRRPTDRGDNVCFVELMPQLGEHLV